jgi:ketosteroid isomerase-like protein
MSSIDQPYFDLNIELGPDSGITETASHNRALLVAAYEAMVSGNDPEALIRLLDPKVIFYEAASLPFGCIEKGPDGCVKGVQGMFSAWSSLRVTFMEFTAAGDIVIAYMRLAGVSRHTGKTYDQPNWEMFRFCDGRIVEWRPIYWDVHEVRQVCGVD